MKRTAFYDHSVLFPVAVTLMVLMSLPQAVSAQNGRNVELLGHLQFNRQGSDVWGYADGNGNEYALVGLVDGTAIVDVTDPANPEQLAFVDGPSAPPFGWRDIKTHSHFAYITSEGTGSGAGMQILDLSALPAAPEVITYDSTFTSAHNLYIDSGFAYVVGTTGAVTGFHILDLSNPISPVAVGAYVDHYVHDIYVRDNIAYASAINNGTLEILDVSDKSNIATLASARSPQNTTHNAWLSEDGNFVLTTDETSGGHLLIWDISDLENIELVSQYESGEGISIHNVHVKGNLAHVSYYVDGYRVIDISDPSKPVEIGFYDTFPQSTNSLFNGNWGVYPYAPSGNVYLSDIQTGLYIVRVDENAQTGEISGFVTRQSNGAPIAGASLHLVEANKYLTTDASGFFSLPIFIGEHTIVTTAKNFLSDTVAIQLDGGENRVLVVNLIESDAALSTSLSSVEIELEAGSVHRQFFTITNTGNGELEYRIRDVVGPLGTTSAAAPVEHSKLAWDLTQLRQALKASGTQTVFSAATPAAELEMIIEDPVGDVVGGSKPDVVAVHGGVEEGVVTFQFEFAHPVIPDSSLMLLSLDTDQNNTTGANPPGSTLGAPSPPGADIASDFEVLWDLNNTIGNGAGVYVFTFDGQFVAAAEFLVDSNRVTTSFPLSVLDNDDGNLNATGIALVNPITPGIDFLPDRGHGTLGSDVFADVPWIRVSPTRGILTSGESEEIRLDIITLQLQPDTTYSGFLLLEVANLDREPLVIPVELTTTTATAVNENESSTPGSFVLHENYPNPFNPSTTIRYNLAEPATVELAIFDLEGRMVRKLVGGSLPAGDHQIQWDGYDGGGGRAGSGVYFYRLRVDGLSDNPGSVTFQKKMILVK